MFIYVLTDKECEIRKLSVAKNIPICIPAGFIVTYAFFCVKLLPIGNLALISNVEFFFPKANFILVGRCDWEVFCISLRFWIITVIRMENRVKHRAYNAINY